MRSPFDPREDATPDDVITGASLAGIGNPARDYVHRDKVVTPRPLLALPESRLKWYDLARAEIPPPESVVGEAREFVVREYAERRLAIAGDLGFVILHRCSETFYFLIVSTWRNENELWETVYAKADDGAFAVFPLPGPHRGTYCVWELGPVWHERQAWRRYLASARDDAAKRAYLENRCAGPV